MTDLTPREILDAFDRALEKVAQQFAKGAPAMPAEPLRPVPAGQTDGDGREADKTGTA